MDCSFPCLTSVWELKKINPGQLSEELSFSFLSFFKSTANQFPSRLSLLLPCSFLLPYVPSIHHLCVCVFVCVVQDFIWRQVILNLHDVAAVPGCPGLFPNDWGCAGPAIARTYLGQEIHWLMRCYFCIPCFSDYNHTPETYLDWSLSVTHKSPQSVLNTG